MTSRGLLITFEGGDGSGKTTLIRVVARRLRQLDRAVVLTREPGGTRLAESIRRLILEKEMDPFTELFLYEASRAEHVRKKILPAITLGKVVLCDRFTDSSLAYQGHARGLDWKKIKTLNHLATGGKKPDLTLLLDSDPKVSLRRVRRHTRFEREGVSFQKRVRKGFLRAMREDPKRWLILKAHSTTPRDLADRVIRHMVKRHLI